MAQNTYVALLRGINVGGNGKVSMAELKVCFEKLGFTSVTTYINSGNVVFNDGETNSRKLAEKIEEALHATFSFPISVVVHSLEQMEKLIAQMPKSWKPGTNLRCYVVFLRPDIDDPGILAKLDPKPEIEEVAYHPGVVFWSTKLSGLTKTNMTKLVGTPLYKEMTVRNQNTVRKILEIMRHDSL